MRTRLLKKTMLSIFLVTAFFGFSTLTAQAVESITFKWRGSTDVKSIIITATSGKTFNVDWGNETPNSVFTGTGSANDISQPSAYGNTDEYTVVITAGSEDCLFTVLIISEQEAIYLDVSKAPSLTHLYCDKNSLESLDVSTNTALTQLYCSNNPLGSLDVRTNTALTKLYCHSNSLDSLDVSKNTALTALNCEFNSLDSLDVSKNTALTTLYCDNNSLTSLDVSKNTALTALGCDNNHLGSLDVRTNTALTTLNCSKNPLTSLDVRTNTALTSLYCSYNSLTSLDVRTNTALTRLECYANSLDSLDVRTNTALTTLYCNNNSLVSLDVRTNTALTQLYCYNNSLDSLDVSTNTALTRLYCYNNSLDSLDVSTNTVLTYLDCSNNALSLQNMKTISEIASITYKTLGEQTLPIAVINEAEIATPIKIDSVFNGVNTVFTVTKNGVTALENTDYTITNGAITFLHKGEFKVKMTNPAITSTSVTARFIVASDDATLSSLTVSEGTLTPVFASAITEYTVSVDNSITSLSITATATDGNATVEGDGMKSLNAGPNVLEIVVTAEDGNTKKTYKVTVTREADSETPDNPASSSDARLSSILLSEGTLSPEFKYSVMDYTAVVGSETDEIEIKVITSNNKALIEGAGVKRLIHGENTFTITVTAEKGNKLMYNLVITREASPVGIENIDQDALQIYPNPVTDYFRVKGLTEPAVVSVYSLQGSVLLQRKVEADENIYVGNLSPGIYLITADGKTFKVLKK